MNPAPMGDAHCSREFGENARDRHGPATGDRGVRQPRESIGDSGVPTREAVHTDVIIISKHINRTREITYFHLKYMEPTLPISHQ